MTQYKKPLPVISEVNRPFWEAAKKHKLVAQKCGDCGHLQLPPAPVCSNCLSSNRQWRRLKGTGQIWSYVVVHHPYFESFVDDIPYNVAYVKLDEGQGITTNIIGVKNEDLRIGMRVEVYFEDVTDDVTLPKFKPALIKP